VSKKLPIQVRVNLEQKRILTRAATKAGLEVSSWIRALALAEAFRASHSSRFADPVVKPEPARIRWLIRGVAKVGVVVLAVLGALSAYSFPGDPHVFPPPCDINPATPADFAFEVRNEGTMPVWDIYSAWRIVKAQNVTNVDLLDFSPVGRVLTRSQPRSIYCPVKLVGTTAELAVTLRFSRFPVPAFILRHYRDDLFTMARGPHFWQSERVTTFDIKADPLGKLRWQAPSLGE
jgi:hypothetical protein